MANLESKLLSENRASNPIFYNRYVDDIFAIFQHKRHINLFIQRLQRSSVLSFTHEEMTNNKFNFLDVDLILKQNGKFTTAVYVKPTDSGSYSNYQSHTPLSYKKSVIKTLVHRAFRYNSSWDLLHTELNRIRQVLANNNYPQATVDDIIRRIMNNHMTPKPRDPATDLAIYVKLTSIKNFKQDSNQLKSIVKEHVKPTDSSNTIKLVPYFKPQKLLSCFSTRVPTVPLKTSHVVYQHYCSMGGCNATYIGYTSCRLEQRIQQHRYRSSSIYKHQQNDHPSCPIPDLPTFQSSFKILHKYNNVTDLKLVEALAIRENSSFINVKYNEMSLFLNIYK